MKLEDALIGEKAGELIVAGQITFLDCDLGQYGLRPPEHDFVSLRFSPTGLDCSPVTSVTRLDNGFCLAEASPPDLNFMVVTKEVLDKALGQRDVATVSYEMEKIGGCQYLGFGPAAQKNRGSISQPIDAVTLIGKLTAEGLELTITAKLGETSPASIGSHATPPPPGRVRIASLIPWPSLVIKEFKLSHRPLGGARPEVADDSPVVRNSTALQDLILQSEFGTAYTLGEIRIAGRRIAPRYCRVKGGEDVSDDVIWTSIGDHSFSFMSVFRFVRLMDGFFNASWRAPRFTLNTLGRAFLVDLLKRRDRAISVFQGDAIGHVENMIGYAAADNMGNLWQPVTAFSLNAALGADGLRLRIAGELGDIDPDTLGNSKGTRYLPQRSQFDIDTTLPWNLLIARNFFPVFRRNTILENSTRT